MPILQLNSPSKKAVTSLMAGDHPATSVEYIKYRGDLYRRDLTKLSNGQPDPCAWIELARDETPVAGAQVVDGKSLIVQTAEGQNDGSRYQATGNRVGSSLIAMTNRAVVAEAALDAALTEVKELKDFLTANGFVVTETPDPVTPPVAITPAVPAPSAVSPEPAVTPPASTPTPAEGAPAAATEAVTVIPTV